MKKISVIIIKRDTLSTPNLTNLYQFKIGNKSNRAWINKIIKYELGYSSIKTLAKISRSNKI